MGLSDGSSPRKMPRQRNGTTRKRRSQDACRLREPQAPVSVIHKLLERLCLNCSPPTSPPRCRCDPPLLVLLASRPSPLRVRPFPQRFLLTLKGARLSAGDVQLSAGRSSQEDRWWSTQTLKIGRPPHRSRFVVWANKMAGPAKYSRSACRAKLKHPPHKHPKTKKI